MRVPLIDGSYTSRSIIANAQRCVNLFAEQNSKSALVPLTFYSAPGLTHLAFPAISAPARCLYWANNGSLYYVCGARVYLISSTWTMTLLGTITTSTGIVSMADNGTSLVLVDGSTNGYVIDLVSNIMEPISEANNAPPPLGGGVYAFYGADRNDMLDGFMLFNQPGTRNFYSTYNNEIVFDALWFAAKNGYSDNLVTIIVTRREIWLLGERTTEIWFDSGDANFPFQIMPGPFIQHGCIAKHSVAQVDGANFWLAQDQAGHVQVVRCEGYAAKVISNPAMENEFASYAMVSDAEAFCFTMNGHTFYQLNFPTANKTWRWDDRTPEIWHEAVWTDDNGGENRHRAACAAWAYGTNVCADWQTGELYAFDLSNVTDAGQPMQFRRGYPHLMNDGRRVIYPGFTLDVEAATSPATQTPVGPFPLYDDIASSPGVASAGGLISDGGVLTVIAGWPTFTTTPGAFYSNGGVCTVFPGGTFNPDIGPIYYGQINAAQLLALGGNALPFSDPGVVTQLWNSFGEVTVSFGPAQPVIPMNMAVWQPVQPIDAGPVEDALLAGPAPAGQFSQPIVNLRWSDDRGRTWSNPVPQSLGSTGRYLTQPSWSRTGMGRDRVFEVFGTVPGKLAINGAFLDPAPIPMES